MADIELVVKIPEEMYKKLLNKGSIVCLSGYERVIANGIPLPKEYGKLIILSEDIVKREQVSLDFSCQKWISEVGLSNATIATIEDKKNDNT